jgi:hypothetical protein
LSRVMDDQGKRAPERRTRDIQFHWNIRWHRHGCLRPEPCWRQPASRDIALP